MTVTEILIIVILVGVVATFLYATLQSVAWETEGAGDIGLCSKCGEHFAPEHVTFEGFAYYRCDPCSEEWVHTPESNIWWTGHFWF